MRPLRPAIENERVVQLVGDGSQRLHIEIVIVPVQVSSKAVLKTPDAEPVARAQLQPVNLRAQSQSTSRLLVASKSYRQHQSHLLTDQGMGKSSSRAQPRARSPLAERVVVNWAAA